MTDTNPLIIRREREKSILNHKHIHLQETDLDHMESQKNIGDHLKEENQKRGEKLVHLHFHLYGQELIQLELLLQCSLVTQI